jgi:hypothetical protein
MQFAIKNAICNRYCDPAQYKKGAVVVPEIPQPAWQIFGDSSHKWWHFAGKHPATPSGRLS